MVSKIYHLIHHDQHQNVCYTICNINICHLLISSFIPYLKRMPQNKTKKQQHTIDHQQQQINSSCKTWMRLNRAAHNNEKRKQIYKIDHIPALSAAQPYDPKVSIIVKVGRGQDFQSVQIVGQNISMGKHLNCRVVLDPPQVPNHYLSS